VACELSRYRNRELVVQLAKICAENHEFKGALNAAEKALRLSVAPQEIQSARQLLEDLRQKEAVYGQEVFLGF
jgi:hypothetical protein